MRPALTIVADLLDAVRVTDDHVTGVLGLVDGRLGGTPTTTTDPRPGRVAQVAAALGIRRGELARGMAYAYGPDQLRKAAVESVRLPSLAAELRQTGRCARLVTCLDEADVASLPQELARLSPRSAELREVQLRLSRVQGAAMEAETRLLLGRPD